MQTHLNNPNWLHGASAVEKSFQKDGKCWNDKQNAGGHHKYLTSVTLLTFFPIHQVQAKLNVGCDFLREKCQVEEQISNKHDYHADPRVAPAVEASDRCVEWVFHCVVGLSAGSDCDIVCLVNLTYTFWVLLLYHCEMLEKLVFKRWG